MKYRHYKGSVYMVIFDNAKREDNGERQIVYTDGDGSVWIRPYNEFHDYLEDGRKRFTFIGD